MAAAMLSGLPSTTIPVLPLRTAGANPTSGVTTTGQPTAIASRTTFPKVLRVRGKNQHCGLAEQVPLVRAVHSTKEPYPVRNACCLCQSHKRWLIILLVIPRDCQVGLRNVRHGWYQPIESFLPVHPPEKEDHRTSLG